MKTMFDRYTRLGFEYRGRVLRIAIQGLGSVNAIDSVMHEELAQVFSDAQRDPDSDIVVLTGSGKTFCAGGDMKWFKDQLADPRLVRDAVAEGKRIIHSLLELEKPTICRINGAAIGLGASMALLCDIIVADETAKIGDPHVKVGLVAADGGSIIWPQLIGFAKAKEYLLTGDLLTGAEAARLGLINYAVPAVEIDAKVDELVEKIAANPRWAVRWTKSSINTVLRDIAGRVSDSAFALEVLSSMTSDRREAVEAFLERRTPHFTGE